MKTTIFAFMILVCVVISSGAQSTVWKKSTDVTSETIAVEFMPELAEQSAGGYFKIQGKVKNMTSSPYRFVQVFFTLKDRAGNFIARQSSYTKPSDVGIGQVGYIDAIFSLKSGEVMTIEYTVTGQK